VLVLEADFWHSPRCLFAPLLQLAPRGGVCLPCGGHGHGHRARRGGLMASSSPLGRCTRGILEGSPEHPGAQSRVPTLAPGACPPLGLSPGAAPGAHRGQPAPGAPPVAPREGHQHRPAPPGASLPLVWASHRPWHTRTRGGPCAGAWLGQIRAVSAPAPFARSEGLSWGLSFHGPCADSCELPRWECCCSCVGGRLGG